MRSRRTCFSSHHDPRRDSRLGCPGRATLDKACVALTLLSPGGPPLRGLIAEISKLGVAPLFAVFAKGWNHGRRKLVLEWRTTLDGGSRCGRPRFPRNSTTQTGGPPSAFLDLYSS